MKLGTDSDYVMIIFDNLTKVKETYGNISLLSNCCPRINKNDCSLKDINWEEMFIKAPSLVKNKMEALTTKEGDKFLLIFECFGQRDEWIMIMIGGDKSNLFQTTNNQKEVKSENFLYKSKNMKRIIDIIYQVASVNSTILLLGETGVGKTRLSHLIHQASTRADKPFISVNCSTIPNTLVESELFGYEDGAFTGGKKGGKSGLLEEADTGTIFLDEIAELPLNIQVKLLDVIQENVIRKIGSTKSKIIDLRIIAATNKNLKEMVNQGLFREDLYYRLNVVPLVIPPLRERKEEISQLILYFEQKFNNKYGLNVSLPNHLIQSLKNYHWPGNIRELENVIERIIVTDSHEWNPSSSDDMVNQKVQLKEIIPLKKAKRLLEIELITRAYKKYKTTYKTAEILEVDQSTIAKKIKTYKIKK